MKSDMLLPIVVLFIATLTVGCKKKEKEPAAPITPTAPKISPAPDSTKTGEQQPSKPRSITGMYEYTSGLFKTAYQFSEEGGVTNLRNGKKTWEGFWSINNDRVMVTKPTGSGLIFKIIESDSIVHIANVKNGQLVELDNLSQANYTKMDPSAVTPPPAQPTELEKDNNDKSEWIGSYASTQPSHKKIVQLADQGIAVVSSENPVMNEKGIWTSEGGKIVVMTKSQKMVFDFTEKQSLVQIATINELGKLILLGEEKQVEFIRTQ